MAKELPYFRFTAQEWQNRDISLESYELKGLFIDICSYYWVKDCSITVAMLEKRFKNDKKILNELIDLNIIKLKEDSEFIEITFLDGQFDMLSEQRKRRQDAGSKGGKKKSSNAKAKPQQKYSYKDNNKDNNKDKYSKEDQFEFFWTQYHLITKIQKTDKVPAFNYFKKLTLDERRKAYTMIQGYSDSNKDKQYIKKARTYLSDKCFNDEFKAVENSKIYRKNEQ